MIKEDPTKYREKHPEILSLEQTILARIGIAKKEMQERVDIAKKAFLYFGQIENFIQKLPTEIQQIPAIRDRITGVRKLMDDCRSNPLLYKTKITEFSQFQEFINENKVIYEELLEEEAFLKKMADISFNSDSTSQDNAKKLLERVKALKQGMGGRTRDADIDEFQLDTQNIKIEYSKRALVAGREKWKSDNIDTVKISLRDKLKDATERKDFAKSL